MLHTVIKRDQREVPFEPIKIYQVIEKAMMEAQKNGRISDKTSQQLADDPFLFISRLTQEVVATLKATHTDAVDVETIQDEVEQVLRAYCQEIAEVFHRTRTARHKARMQRDALFQTVKAITTITDRENANVGQGPSAKFLQIAEASARVQAEHYLPEHIATFVDKKLIYPHDFAWSAVGTTTCTHIPLRHLLKGGFDIEGKHIREPKRISSAAALACIALQSNQNDQHGGQSYGWFDRDLAPYVDKEYQHQRKDLTASFNHVNCCVPEDVIDELAWEKTRDETQRAMEAVVYNLNTMHARSGAQVPFSSINVGTDITKGGRLITECLLNAYEDGLGNHEQPLFPNIIFKVKKGVNYEPHTPNHDLLKQSLRVSSVRLYPIYCFQDCTLNAPFEEDIPTMGCRTRVASNLHHEDQHPEGRGNLSFTTLNLPGIALEKRNSLLTDAQRAKYKQLLIHYQFAYLTLTEKEQLQSFMVRLDECVEIAIEQLLDRYKHQCRFKKADFSFLMSGVWLDSETLEAQDTLESVLKHGTLTVGFIGLAEALTVLVGKHHGESKVALAIGLDIVSFLAQKMKEATNLYRLNFGIVATPAEGLTGKLVSHDQALYGKIKGVTDKEWYTNSCHVPVECKMSIREKLTIEGLFVKDCTAGTITYVELTEAPTQNVEAMYQLLQLMSDADIALGAVNFPSNRCLSCGFTGALDLSADCPVCASEDVERIGRITGYLAPLERFNAAKKAEFEHRVKHD